MTKSISDFGISLSDLAARVGGSVEGDGEVLIFRLAPIETAGPGDLSFVANQKYIKHIATTGASALILAPDMPGVGGPVLRHELPYLTFARVLALFHPDRQLVPTGVHPTAVVHPDAQVDASAAVGPLCHIEQGACIGQNCQLLSGVYVGEGTVLGNGCLVYPGVRIMHGCKIGCRAIFHAGVVIGSDGFGFAPSPQGAVKIRQIGGVEIGDDVEIGANSTVDRGALGPTRIGHRTKLDNHVQIGHNVQVGDDCILVAAVAIAGSSTIGNRVTLAGQVAVVGHIEIGDDTVVGAQSCVMKSCPPGQTWLGFPAQDAMIEKRQEAALRRLPELLKRVKKLETLLADRQED